jgi:glutathione S-transferase
MADLRGEGTVEARVEALVDLVGDYTLADIAHAGNFQRLRILAKSSEITLHEYPNVMEWMERVEDRELQGFRVGPPSEHGVVGTMAIEKVFAP